MTTVGKIFVLVNFVFSLIAAGLIIFLNAASTNWHRVAEEQKKKLEVANANVDTYRAELKEALARAKEAYDKKDNEVKDAERQIKTLTSRVAELTNQLEKTAVSGKQIDSSRVTLTQELERQKNEVAALNALLVQRDKRILELERDKKELRDRAVLAELNQKSEQDRNEKLLAQLETLTKEIQKLKNGNGRLASRRNPPAEDVEGVVKDIDPQTGFLTLSIGSDAGLAPGNTLEAFRLAPEAKYLGLVEILDVRPDAAVAKPIDPLRRGTIRTGDRVASNITTRR